MTSMMKTFQLGQTRHHNQSEMFREKGSTTHGASYSFPQVLDFPCQTQAVSNSLSFLPSSVAKPTSHGTSPSSSRKSKSTPLEEKKVTDDVEMKTDEVVNGREQLLSSGSGSGLDFSFDFDDTDELMLKSTDPSLDLSNATFHNETLCHKNMTVVRLQIGTFLVGREVATLLKRQTFNMYRSMKLRGIGILRAIPEHLEFFSQLGVVKLGTHSLTLVPYDEGTKFIKDCKLREARLEKRKKRAVLEKTGGSPPAPPPSPKKANTNGNSRSSNDNNSGSTTPSVSHSLRRSASSSSPASFVPAGPVSVPSSPELLPSTAPADLKHQPQDAQPFACSSSSSSVASFQNSTFGGGSSSSTTAFVCKEEVEPMQTYDVEACKRGGLFELYLIANEMINELHEAAHH